LSDAWEKLVLDDHLEVVESGGGFAGYGQS